MITHANQFDRGQLSHKYLTSFQRQLLAKQLKIETIPEYRQRLEIMLLADDGHTQTQICRLLSCSPLTARHWIFMAKSGCAHNWQTQPIGRPKIITSEYVERLKELINTSPKELGYAFSRWTGQWLSKQLSQELNIQVSARHINRLLGDLKADGISECVTTDRQYISSHHLTIVDLPHRSSNTAV